MLHARLRGRNVIGLRGTVVAAEIPPGNATPLATTCVTWRKRVAHRDVIDGESRTTCVGNTAARQFATATASSWPVRELERRGKFHLDQSREAVNRRY